MIKRAALLLWLGLAAACCAGSKTATVTPPPELPLTGPWDITFPLAKGKAAKSLHTDLFSWPKSDDADIRYYSGTVAYAKSFELPANYSAADRKLYLDLGNVQKVARVRVNGQPCPDVWKAPFRVEITALVKPGANRIEVDVTNTWANRLIGDEQLPSDLRYQRYLTALPAWFDGSVPRESARQTFTLQRFFDKGDALSPSGLLGLVVIRTTHTIEL